MKKEEFSHKILILLLVVFGLAIFFIVNDYIAYVYYPGGWGSGWGYGAGFSILDLYDDYHEWFDFFIFFAVFMSLTKMIFKEHFDEGGKALYTGLGVLLSLGLLFWERNTGYSILELFGGYAFLLLMLALLFYVFNWVKKASDSGLLGAGIAILLFYIFLGDFFRNVIYYPLQNVMPYSVMGLLETVMNILPVVAVIMIVWGAWRLIFPAQPVAPGG